MGEVPTAAHMQGCSGNSKAAQNYQAQGCLLRGSQQALISLEVCGCYARCAGSRKRKLC